MSERSEGVDRRTVLKAAAAILVGGIGLAAAAGQAAGSPPPAPAAPVPSGAGSEQAVPPGKPGDFAFLAGEWRIRHRRRKAAGKDEWDEFEGEATCWTILGGVGSVEELRIPARGFSGMGLRLLDVEKHVWSDFWVNARSGVLTTPGTTGGFVDGVGTFAADDMDGERPIRVKGVWDQITPVSCRWYQAVSWNGGKTWEENWIMHWVRA